MDGASMNRYEKQLYTVFKTFDVDNEEALDRSAVYQLCDALQLEDRGASLVNTLFERRSDRVTFAQFRNGLLAVLGGASGDQTRDAPAPSSPPEPPPLPDPPHHSDDDSSGREMAPKFVFGSKKYGRRSRPPRAGAAPDEPASPRSSSASRLDTDDKRARQRMRCRRSASAMESRDDNSVLDGGQEDVTSTETFEHDRRIDRDEALALCRGLNMDGIDRHIIDRIFEDSGTIDTTVGEFFDRLNATLTTTMEEATREVRAPATTGDGSAEATDDDVAGGLSSELVLEAWERAGVQQPRRLLAELGFGAAALRPPDLERALDDELRAFAEPPNEPHDARALLLLAALALSRLRLELARRRADRAAAERDKLRGDVAEANRHARLLAQEVDESHARIEAELKASLRRAEARHAEAMRQTAAENSAERERTATARARLEAEVERRADAEARLRSEAALLRSSADELEARVVFAEERRAETERECARLAAELRAEHERGEQARAGSAVPAAEAARLEELRRDNQLLRDRNDELCAELELLARRGGAAQAHPARGGDLSAELDSLLTHERLEDCNSSPVSIDQRILGHIEAVTRLRNIFESVHVITSIGETDCRSCATVADALRLVHDKVRELSESVILAEQADVSVQTDAPTDSHALRRELLEAERKHDDEKRKLSSLVKDLETSLEQMKAEYDKCEEYWSGKLEEERDMYTEEQRLGDERLADLVAKIAEYERQFAHAPALPTIDERHSLETQFTDLEDEFARYRRDKEAELSARVSEAARLAERVEALERRREAEARAASPSARRRAREPRLHDAPPDPPKAGEAGQRHAGEAGLRHAGEAGVRHAGEAGLRHVGEAGLRHVGEAGLRHVGEAGLRHVGEAGLRHVGEAGLRHVGEVRELRARTARAEAAARRLHARLAAADLLVKDLYVENCQLAHRRPL